MDLQGILFIVLVLLSIVCLSVGVSSLNKTLKESQGFGFVGFIWILIAIVVFINIPLIIEQTIPILDSVVDKMPELPDWLKGDK